jgi:hypothetical protein
LCLAGAVDALWRYYFARAAGRRYVAGGERFDVRTERLVKIARVNDATLLLQGVLAAAISAKVAGG